MSTTSGHSQWRPPATLTKSWMQFRLVLRREGEGRREGGEKRGEKVEGGEERSLMGVAEGRRVGGRMGRGGEKVGGGEGRREGGSRLGEKIGERGRGGEKVRGGGRGGEKVRGGGRGGEKVRGGGKGGEKVGGREGGRGGEKVEGGRGGEKVEGGRGGEKAGGGNLGCSMTTAQAAFIV